ALLLEQQEVVNRLSLEIGNAASLEEIFPVIKREIGVLVHSPALFISLFDRKNKLITPVYVNIEGEELNISDFPVLPLEPEGMGVQSQVVRTGKSLILNDWREAVRNSITHYDIKSDGKIVKTNEETILEGLPKSGLVVPMKSERQVFGLFMIQCKDSHTYTVEDCNFLEGVANVTAVAVQNLKLVSDLDKQVKELQSAHASLQQLLEEKEVLLKEIHHRVKNNMQVVYSLLNMQIHETEDARSIEVLQESQSRIRSMALVHEKLYDSADQASINAEDFIHTITHELMGAYDAVGRINCVIDVSDVTLDINIAVPCGLVVNEILSNAFKYAFPNERRGTISISVTPLENNFLKIRISDDGIGLPDDFDFQQISTMGMTLVRILVQGQLDGTITVDGKEGTTFDITFPLDPA
ncbi:MAG: GAF domain-containing protein, partial [FCB group bacterium]|nr:GAF domain-containing protein [FCB group bacterium]